MNTAVLTFPGHTLQTTLSIKSLLEHTEIADLTVLVDDISARSWDTYVDDLQAWLTQQFPDQELEFLPYSRLDFQDCASGWWRAQLIKLHSDVLLPDWHEWLLVDGDVIFERWRAIKGVTPYTSSTPGKDTPVAILHQNYVKNLLGIDQGHLEVNGQYVATSPVPFRVLDRDLLRGLRSHVESRFGSTLMDLHLRWFRDQTIIAYEDPPQRMIMTEWELIECYRRYVCHHDGDFLQAGSGYPLDLDLDSLRDPVLYRHSYLRDSDIALEWFEHRLGAVPDHLWQHITDWVNQYEKNQ